MSATLPSSVLPDHTQLPESDGAIVQNFQEHPQSMLLTDTITPVLQRLHPDGRYAIGQDSGIYWRYVAEDPLQGCKAPDWFLVRGVEPLLNGQIRRSYVLWAERVIPSILLEMVSGDGSDERDRTPGRGKFWVYEQAVRAPYYGIYEVDPGRVELYGLEGENYVRLEPNERGHYPIPPLGVELGIWEGRYQNLTLPWLRWWDAQGNLLPTAAEQVEHSRKLADRLAQKLRSLGIDPEAP